MNNETSTRGQEPTLKELQQTPGHEAKPYTLDESPQTETQAKYEYLLTELEKVSFALATSLKETLEDLDHPPLQRLPVARRREKGEATDTSKSQYTAFKLEMGENEGTLDERIDQVAILQEQLNTYRKLLSQTKAVMEEAKKNRIG